ncbi:MAG: hypothetical protein ACRD50_07100 [Candidatus Acidiferrales bacterium]
MNKETSMDYAKIVDLLRDLLITSLGAAGVKQTEIRKILGCDMNRVNRIVKHIEQKHKQNDKKE